MMLVVSLPFFPAVGEPPEKSESPASAAEQTGKSGTEAEQKTTPAGEADLSWMPRQETGAFNFLAKHPEADGRGVVVAIFDTGVDPGAAGLQTTPDGRPKVIDIVDGTGSGDVSMGEPAQAENHQLTGLSGRTLKLNPDWKNPKGEFRIGMKSGYELLPPELVQIIKPEREKKFRNQAQLQRAQLVQDVANWKTANPKPDDNGKKQLAELEARVTLLDDMLKQYADPGPIYDCVVFHDGEHFRAVIDTDEDGDLAEEAVLTNFRVAREWDTFADPINMNFGVNIYDE
ncbi:MAG: S8 family serine peptidase, partial [Planctomycetaceae bacterium]|nr:S8 family serine peptidase [Planctomycetaceae bacterium]